MGLLLRSLAMLCLSSLLLWWHDIANAQSSGLSARALDATLQDYAFRAFVRPKTGVPFNATVPSNLTGIGLAAMRLRSGSLYRRGVNFSEFEIRDGVLVSPYEERLVLVYQNLGNRSISYYPLHGFTYLAPIVGLLAYDAADLSGKNLPELDLQAYRRPILIKFESVDGAPRGTTPQCVWFELDGSPSFSNVMSGNVCSTFKHGHFSIVVQSIAPTPAPSEVPKREGKKGNSRRVWIILGSVLGGLVLLALLAALVVWCWKLQKRKRMKRMERAADVGEPLHMTPVGDTRAPAATVTRTQPVLESEYVP